MASAARLAAACPPGSGEGSTVSNHISRDLLEAFAAGTLHAEDLARVDVHLASCEVCRTGAGPHRGPPTVLDAVNAERRRHLRFDQLAAMASGNDDGLDALARNHLALCRGCQKELEDLRDFERSLDVTPARGFDGTPAVGAAPKWWRSFWPLGGLAAAAAAVALGLYLGNAERTRSPDQGSPPALELVLRPHPAGPSGGDSGANKALLPPVAPTLPERVRAQVEAAAAEAARTGVTQRVTFSLRRSEYADLAQALAPLGALDVETPADRTRAESGPEPIWISLTVTPPAGNRRQ